MDVRLPDGTIIRNVPEGTTKAQIVQKLRNNGMPVPGEWLMDKEPPSAREKLLASTPMRLAKGLKDPIEGAAQILPRLLPESVVNAVNKAADYVGGEGTFLGDVLGIKGATPKQLVENAKQAEQEYQQARERTGQTGFDAARFTGNVLSPANAALTRVLPMPKATDTLKTLAAKGAAGGAVGAGLQPVVSGDFGEEKTKQVVLGGLGGAVLTPAMTRAGESVARYIQNKISSGTIPKTPEGIEQEIRASFKRDNIDLDQIPKEMIARLRDDAAQALRQGRQVDAATLLRKQDFESLGIKPTLGQVTRDPGQYTRELNLRGIQGAGEPIQQRLAEQQAQLAQRLQRGAAAETPFEAGEKLTSQLRARDEQLRSGVREAYQAFKQSTGKDLEVPTAGLANDYAETLRDFADNIPAAVRSRFESLGLLSGTQKKLLTIDDAENLIKTINKNYDPKNAPQSRALDELRRSVERAIADVGQDAGAEAAILAGGARSAAKDRFTKIAESPAFRAAINNAEPDDFVKKYVINGKVNEINRLAELVGPEGADTMRGQLRAYLQSKALGTNAAGDAAVSQANYNRALESIGKNKLIALLGKQETDELYRIGRVMAYIQQRPAGSAVNESNTGAAVANLVSKIGGTIKGAPYISDFVIQPMRNFRDRSAAEAALAAQLPKSPNQLSPESVNALSAFLRPLPVGAGAALGYSVR